MDIAYSSDDYELMCKKTILSIREVQRKGISSVIKMCEDGYVIISRNSRPTALMLPLNSLFIDKAISAIIQTHEHYGSAVYEDETLKKRIYLDKALLKSALKSIYEEAQHDIDIEKRYYKERYNEGINDDQQELVFDLLVDEQEK